MSFPRARNKRFNEEIGFGPGVGHYDPKFQATAGPGNPLSFPKGDRFQNDFKDPSQVLGNTPYSSLKKSIKTKSASNISDMPWSAKKQLQFTAHSIDLRENEQKTEANTALEKAESDLKKLQEEFDEVVQTKDSALKELANEKQKFQELEEAFVQEVKLKSSVLMDLNSSTTELSSLQSKFDELTKVADNLTSELEKKSSKLQEVEEKLDSECYDLRNCLAAEVRANKVALMDLDASKLELSDLKSKYNALIRMKDNLELDLENKVRELDIIIENLKSEVISLKGSCSSEEALKISAIAKVNDLKLELVDLNAQFTEIANDKDTVSLELKTKCSQLVELEFEMISLNNTLFSEKAMKEKALTELSDLNSRHSSLVEVNGNTTLALSNKSSDLEKLEIEKDSLNRALITTEKAMATTLSELKVLKTELNDLKSKHDVITVIKDDALLKLESTSNELEKLDCAFVSMKASLVSEEKLKDGALADLISCTSRLSDLEETIVQLSEMKDDALLEAQQISQQLLELKDHFEAKALAFENAIKEETYMKAVSVAELESCSAELTDLKHNFNALSSAKDDAVTDLESKLKELKIKFDIESQALQSSRLDLKAKLLQNQEMENNFNSLQMAHTLLEASSQSQKTEIKTITVDLAKANEVLNLNSNIILNFVAKDKENIELQAANIKEIRYLNQQVQQKSVEMERLDLEATQTREQFERILKEKTTELHEMKMSLEAVNLSNDSLNLELENKTQQVNDLKACIESVNSRNKVLQSDLLQQDREIEELRQQWTEASNSVQVLGLEKQTLEEKCETMRINIIFNEDSIQTLSAELRSKEDDLTSLDANRVRTELATSELSYELEYKQKQFDKLFTENETLMNRLKERELLVEELETKGLESESEVELLRKDLQGKDAQLSSLESKWINCNSSLRNMEEELKAEYSRIANLHQTLTRTQDCLQESLSETASMARKLQSLEERFALSNTSSELFKLELASKDAQVEAVMTSLQDLEQTHQDLKAHAQAQEDQFRAQELLESDLTEQLKSWKTKYEELEAKVAPFKEQLDQYSAERDNLLHENEEAYKEISDLSLKHAELMGHQNHRQKIQYVIRLKQEIVDLKKENSRLRASHVPKPEIPKKPETLKKDSKKALVKNTEAKKTPLKSTENTVFF